MQSLEGETVQEKRRRERRELYELRLAEWWVAQDKPPLFIPLYLFIITEVVSRCSLFNLTLSSYETTRTARLQLTDELIGDLNVGSQTEEISKDVERIQELLSLPQNEHVAQDSSRTQ